MGVAMRMGGYSRFERLLVHCIIVVIILSPLMTIRRSVANPAAVTIPLVRLASHLIAKRAIKTSGMNLARVSSTRLGTRGVLRDSFTDFALANSSMARNGAPTWALAALSVGGYQLAEFINSDSNLQYATDAVLNADGTYTVTVNKNGITQNINVNFEPTQLSPAFIYVNSIFAGAAGAITGVMEGVSYPDNAMYYVSKLGNNPPYLYGDSISNLALQAREARTFSAYAPEIIELQKTAINKLVDSAGNISFTEKVYNLRYVERESSFTFDVLKMNPIGTAFRNPPDTMLYHPDLIGKTAMTEVFVKTSILDHVLKSTFEPCLTVESANGSSITTCAPPKAGDYEWSRREYTDSVIINTNARYAVAKLLATSGDLWDIEKFAKNDLMKQELDYAAVSRLLNELLMKASLKSGYEGLPYDSSRPITENELKGIARELGLKLSMYDLFYSTLPDFDLLSELEPQYKEQLKIINGGASGGNSGEGPDDDNDDPDWKFVPPELEEIPTGNDILSFLDELFPFLRNFKLIEKSAQCPVAEIEAFKHKYIVDTHCPLLEQNRSLFSTIMLIVWSFVSLRIILKS